MPRYFLLMLATPLLAVAAATQNWCPCVRHPDPTEISITQCFTSDGYLQFVCGAAEAPINGNTLHFGMSSNRTRVANGEFLYFCNDDVCYTPAMPNVTHEASVFPGETAGYRFQIGAGRQIVRGDNSDFSVFPAGNLTLDADEFEIFPNLTHWTRLSRRCNSTWAANSTLVVYWSLSNATTARTELVVNVTDGASETQDCL